MFSKKYYFLSFHQESDSKPKKQFNLFSKPPFLHQVKRIRCLYYYYHNVAHTSNSPLEATPIIYRLVMNGTYNKTKMQIDSTKALSK